MTDGDSIKPISGKHIYLGIVTICTYICDNKIYGLHCRLAAAACSCTRVSLLEPRPFLGFCNVKGDLF